MHYFYTGAVIYMP